MANKNIWKTLAGLALASAAVGGALAYAKHCKDSHELGEEDFDDLEAEVTPAPTQEERTYTTLPSENELEEAVDEELEEDITTEEPVTEEETITEESTEETTVAPEA